MPRGPLRSWLSPVSHERSVEACGKQLAGGSQTFLVGIQGSWTTTLTHTEFAKISVICLLPAFRTVAPFPEASLEALWEVKMYASFPPPEAFVTVWNSVHLVPFWPQHCNPLWNPWFCRLAVSLFLLVRVGATFSCSCLYPKQEWNWEMAFRQQKPRAGLMAVAVSLFLAGPALLQSLCLIQALLFPYSFTICVGISQWVSGVEVRINVTLSNLTFYSQIRLCCPVGSFQQLS